MKNALMLGGDKFLARRRSLIETVIGQLKTILPNRAFETSQSNQLLCSLDGGASGVLPSTPQTVFEPLGLIPYSRKE